MIIDEMESAMRSSSALRRAYAYAENQLPEDLQRRLDDLLTEDQRATYRKHSILRSLVQPKDILGPLRLGTIGLPDWGLFFV